MNHEPFDSPDEIAWCPGCGNFGIIRALKRALTALGRPPKELVLVSGIGQAAKTPHYVKANCFNSLHGRALSPAAAIKLANPKLTVIVTTGDGDCYGEGGNHFLHTVRKNPDLTVIVHDNQLYALTKGQASPTTEPGVATRIQVDGVVQEPLRPLEVAIALGCGFVARGYAGDPDHLAGLIGAGIAHRGLALIDVLQPCLSFNKRNTFAWYAQRVYQLEGHDPTNKAAAYQKAAEWGERIPLGIIYRTERPPYEELRGLDRLPPLVEADLGQIDLTGCFADFR